MIKKALEVAWMAHEGQFDKCDKPYILHPIRMALRLSDERLKVIALLHDVVEDSGITLGELGNDFPPDIVEAVGLLTRRKGEDYESYIRNLKPLESARLVKIEDLNDNLDPNRYFEGRDDTRYENALYFLAQSP